MSKFNVFIYMASILMGAAIIFGGIGSYLENCEIKEEGIEVKVVKLKTKHTNKVYIPQAKYKGKVYDWYGGKGTEGRTYTAIYSVSKDKLFNQKSDWQYFPILMGAFFIGCGIWGVNKEYNLSKKEKKK